VPGRLKEEVLRGSARGARAAAGFLERVSGRLSRMAGARVEGAPLGPDGGPLRYSWLPGTEDEARLQIINHRDEERFEESGRQELKRLLPFVHPGATVLDLGCGIGRVTRPLAPHCGTIWAVDASPQMLEIARGRMAAVPNVRYALCADTVVPEVPDASVDFVYSIIVLQHLEKEDAFLLLEEVVRMLKPGGKAFLTWPDLHDDFYLGTFVRYAHQGEVANRTRARVYTAGELERLLPAAGFSTVELTPDPPDIVAVCTR
jgi:2-polyprenyl-3-methyl-5-hydroxy-6-metoxy-1,4-benzoquinol methylase